MTDSPGPGEYEQPLSTKKREPTCILGKAKLERYRFNSIPGPAEYSRMKRVSAIEKNLPIFLQEDLNEVLLSILGLLLVQGCYNSITVMGKGPKYRMRLKSTSSSFSKLPGPADYNPISEKIRVRPPSAVIGCGSRNASYIENPQSPGPAAYMSRKLRKGPQYTFGTSRKQHRENLSPGPVSYQINRSFAHF